MYKAISVSGEPEIIGNKGIHQVELDRKALNKDPEMFQIYNFFNSQFLWEKQEEGFDINIPPIKAKMLKKAKLTDIMRSTPNIMAFKWVISERFLNVIKQFNIGQYVTFEIEIENIEDKYYFLFKKAIILKEIDYSNSTLYTGHKISGDLQHYSFQDYDCFWRKLDENPLMRFEKIAIDKKYQNEDIIFTQASTHAFFSERLIDILLDAGMTGLETSSSVSLGFSKILDVRIN